MKVNSKGRGLELSNNRAGLHKELGFLVLCLLFLLFLSSFTGCIKVVGVEKEPKKHFDCEWDEEHKSWTCVSRVSNKRFHCHYLPETEVPDES